MVRRDSETVRFRVAMRGVIMKIAMVHHYWTFPEVAYPLPRALARKGHEISAFVWSGSRERGRIHSEGRNFNVFSMPAINFAPSFSGFVYPALLGFGAAIDSLRPDLIDCQSHLFPTAHQSVCSASRLGVPLVITVNGIMAPRGSIINAAQRAYMLTAARSAFRRASAVRCLTQSDALEVMRYGCPREKIRVIPNGVDTGLFSMPSSRGESKVVAWSGRFVAEKDVSTLIRAASIVLKSHPDAKFILAGDGPGRTDAIALARSLGISSSVDFPGAMQHGQLAYLLKSSSVFAFPSIKEGMPFSLLEAMSCGNPVVGSDIPGISSVVTRGSTGVLVPPGQSEEFAAAISGLFADPALRHQMGSQAGALIRRDYSLERVAGMVERLYLRTASRFG